MSNVSLPSPEEARRLATKFLSPLTPRPSPPEKRPRTMTIGEWAAIKAKQLGVSTHAIQSRLSRGTMKYPKVKRVNPRLIYVIMDEDETWGETGTTG